MSLAGPGARGLGGRGVVVWRWKVKGGRACNGGGGKGKGRGEGTIKGLAFVQCFFGPRPLAAGKMEGREGKLSRSGTFKVVEALLGRRCLVQEKKLTESGGDSPTAARGKNKLQSACGLQNTCRLSNACRQRRKVGKSEPGGYRVHNSTRDDYWAPAYRVGTQYSRRPTSFLQFPRSMMCAHTGVDSTSTTTAHLEPPRSISILKPLVHHLRHPHHPILALPNTMCTYIRECGVQHATPQHGALRVGRGTGGVASAYTRVVNQSATWLWLFFPFFSLLLLLPISNSSLSLVSRFTTWGLISTPGPPISPPPIVHVRSFVGEPDTVFLPVLRLLLTARCSLLASRHPLEHSCLSPCLFPSPPPDSPRRWPPLRVCHAPLVGPMSIPAPS